MIKTSPNKKIEIIISPPPTRRIKSRKRFSKSIPEKADTWCTKDLCCWIRKKERSMPENQSHLTSSERRTTQAKKTPRTKSPPMRSSMGTPTTATTIK